MCRRFGRRSRAGGREQENPRPGIHEPRGFRQRGPQTDEQSSRTGAGVEGHSPECQRLDRKLAATAAGADEAHEFWWIGLRALVALVVRIRLAAVARPRGARADVATNCRRVTERLMGNIGMR